MPLKNRVTPFGELFQCPDRGLLMGNRGGRIHDARQELGQRRWASKQWICCRLEFNGRHRAVWGDSYTELFFLDEVTAFAAGHRPCFECRRKDAEHFAELFAGVDPNFARPRVSGNERSLRKRPSAPEIDKILHAERLDRKAKRTHRRNIDTLADGAMIARDGAAYAMRGDALLRWTPSGYAETASRPRAATVEVLTPPSILAVLQRGYEPLWHPSAD